MTSESTSEWDEVHLLGLMPETGIDIVDQEDGWGSADLWVVETEVARIVLDRVNERVTSYPLDGKPRGVHDRTSRAWHRRADLPPTPGEHWALTEARRAADTDPWGDRIKRPVGIVLGVRGIDL